MPESIPGQVAEWQVGVVLVVVPAHEEESGSEAVAQCLAPRNAAGSCLAFVEEIEHRKQEQGLVWSFMTISADTDDANVEVVEAGDGGM